MTDRALTWSYGGGTQSVAIAVLVAQGRLPRPELIVIADTGREASETWEYHERHTAPLLASVGQRVEVAPHSLARADMYDAPGGPLLPAYVSTGGKLHTYCSVEWKQRPVQRYLRQRGYGPRRPVVTWLGMSLDEVGRLRDSDTAWQRLSYPLCFDVRMTRAECRDLVLRAGLPEPPRSSCWCCPFRRNAQWRRLRDLYPSDWGAAVTLDAAIRARDADLGLYLHESRLPLAEADLGEAAEPSTAPLFEAACQTGYCWS